MSNALVVIGVGAVFGAATITALVLHQDHPYAWLAALFPVVGVAYVLIGVVAWRRRPSSLLGLLIVVAGGAWLLAALLNVDTPFTFVVGSITQTLILAVMVQLLLGFPTGRLHSTTERVVVVAGYGVCLVLQIPLYLFAPGGRLSVIDRPDLVDAGVQVQRVAGALVVLATAALLIGRMRRANPAQRRVLVPLSVYGIFALLFVPVSSVVADRWFDGNVTGTVTASLVVIGLVPLVFVAASSRGGFERTGDLAELGAWLGADEAGRPELRDALAASLGDPSVQLLFRVPGGMVDARGLPVDDLGASGDRGMVDVELGGRIVGAVRYDATIWDRPDEIREAGRVVALALDRQRLTVELRASRARIAAAADEERRRIARDLHDGLQSRLVFLAVQADAGEDPGALRFGIGSAIDELRELVNGVMPAPLTERGLGSAVTEMRNRLSMPITLHTNGLDERLRPDIETAAYFVVSEAVVNAVKHSGCDHLAVTLEHDGDELRLEVSDDGRGGAHAKGGMRGMTDRVEALGGVLTVDSPGGGGTRVRAVIPCAS